MTYTIIVEEDVRIDNIRFSRPETGNETTLSADYRPKGTDSRDDPLVVKTLDGVFLKTYSETKPLNQYPDDVVDALIVINNYVESSILAIEFPD